MAYTPYDLPTNITTYTGIGTYLNSISNDMFGLLLIFSIFIISFMSLRNYHLTINLMVTSWMSLIASLFMWTMGWANWGVALLFAITTGIMIIISAIREYGNRGGQE
jgi:hypothetical protein